MKGGQGGDNKLKLLTMQDLPDPNPSLPMPYDGRSYPFQTLAVDPSIDNVVDTLTLDSATAGNKQNIFKSCADELVQVVGQLGHASNKRLEDIRVFYNLVER